MKETQKDYNNIIYHADCDKCKWTVSNKDSTVVREVWITHVLTHHKFMIYTT